MSIINGYIVPHPPVTIPEVAKGREKEVSQTVEAYKQVGQMIAKDDPDTIIIITSHSIMYADYFHISPGDKAHGDMSRFDAPGVCMDVNYDKELAQYISSVCVTSDLNAGGLGEKDPRLDHGTIIPLYHIKKQFKGADYKIVRISLANLSPLVHYKFGKCIAEACEKLKRKAVIIASGDLSHCCKEEGPYGYRHEGPIFDDTVVDIMQTGNFIDFMTFSPTFVENSLQCGLNTFNVLAGALDGRDIDINFLSYERTLGVGYALCNFTPDLSHINPDRQFDFKLENRIKRDLARREEKENPYVKLARTTLEKYVTTKKYLTLSDINDIITEDMLNDNSAVFVTIKKDGAVRGCIGTVTPTTGCLAHEIITNTINAGINDPRFTPITIDELPFLTYSVDVLYDPEPINSLDDLDVKKYGVIVNTEDKRGLLLPNLDSVTTTQQQLEIALKKAGISKDESYEMQRFEVVRY